MVDSVVPTIGINGLRASTLSLRAPTVDGSKARLVNEAYNIGAGFKDLATLGFKINEEHQKAELQNAFNETKVNIDKLSYEYKIAELTGSPEELKVYTDKIDNEGKKLASLMRSYNPRLSNTVATQYNRYATDVKANLMNEQARKVYAYSNNAQLASITLQMQDLATAGGMPNGINSQEFSDIKTNIYANIDGYLTHLGYEKGTDLFRYEKQKLSSSAMKGVGLHLIEEGKLQDSITLYKRSIDNHDLTTEDDTGWHRAINNEIRRREREARARARAAAAAAKKIKPIEITFSLFKNLNRARVVNELIEDYKLAADAHTKTMADYETKLTKLKSVPIFQEGNADAQELLKLLETRNVDNLAMAREFVRDHFDGDALAQINTVLQTMEIAPEPVAVTEDTVEAVLSSQYLAHQQDVARLKDPKIEGYIRVSNDMTNYRNSLSEADKDIFNRLDIREQVQRVYGNNPLIARQMLDLFDTFTSSQKKGLAAVFSYNDGKGLPASIIESNIRYLDQQTRSTFLRDRELFERYCEDRQISKADLDNAYEMLIKIDNDINNRKNVTELDTANTEVRRLAKAMLISQLGKKNVPKYSNMDLAIEVALDDMHLDKVLTDFLSEHKSNEPVTKVIKKAAFISTISAMTKDVAEQELVETLKEQYPEENRIR